MTTNTEHRRRETDKIDLYKAFYELQKANARIAELERIVSDDKSIKICLAMLIRRLGASLLLHKPGHEAPRRAMKFLMQHNLQGSPLGFSPADKQGG